MKRKLLKLLILSLISLVLMIYYVSHKDKINYVVLGDYLSINNDINKGYNYYLIKSLKKNNRLGRYNNYSNEDETYQTLLDRIKNNGNIRLELRESTLVTISVGLNNFYNLTRKDISINNILDIKDKIITLFPEITNLLKEIRKYAKYEVILIGYYNPLPFLFNTNEKELDLLFLYIDSMVKDIAKKYDIKYLSLYNTFKTNNYIINDIYPNTNGYKKIAKEILEKYCD